MRFALLPLAATLLASHAVRADDAADAKAVVEKAIKARGDKPGAAPAVTKWKEKIALDALGQKVDLDTEWTFQSPDELRLQVTVAVQGNAIDLVIIVNGEKMWLLVNGQLQDGAGAQLAEMLTEMNRM